MHKWPEGYLEANGIRVHYYRTGGNKPQVVLSHGAMDDGLCWTRVVKELEQDYDVVMFDARGHGLSDSGQGDYASETRANDLAAAIRALSLEKPVIGGHSMGADASIHLAAMYPDIPQAIFVEDPPITMSGEPLFGGELAAKSGNVGKTMVRIMRLFRVLPILLGKPLASKMMPSSPDDEVVSWLASKKRLNPDFLRAMQDSDNVMDTFPIQAMRKIQVPAMLIMGDRDAGAIVSEQVAGKMAEAIPDLTVVHLPGANHDIRRAKFNGYISALKTFLEKVGT